MTAVAADPALRPLPWRGRTDLEVQPVWLRQQRYWRIKDPISLRYYELRDEEYWLLTALDGRATLAELATGFERRFPQWRLDAARIHGFLATLHAAGLVLSDHDARTGFLQESAAAARRNRWAMALANPLAIRFRGLNPRRLLDRIEPWCGWLLSPPAIVLGLALIVASALLAGLRLDAARLPSLADFVTVENVFVLWLCIAAAKVVHELSHALACRRAGRDCHELGVMLLCFAPCLYCNVSDTWLVPGKWARAGVAAAGIYVELLIAAVAGWLWWLSAPGLFHTVCLNLAIVCSVGTLLFNANPLLRYDGYFVLSDLLETPNLWQQAWAPWQARISRLYLGTDVTSQANANRRPELAVYALASLGYRAFVIAALVWLVFDRLTPYRLTVVAQAFTLLVFGAVVAGTTARTAAVVRDPAVVRRIDRRRFAWRSLGTAAALLGLAFVPLPAWVSAPAVIELASGRVAYVETSGTLREAVRPGAVVAAGSVLARLANDDLERDRIELEGELAQQRQHVRLLESLRLSDVEAGLELPAAQAKVADLTERLARRKNELAQLAVTAPIAGTVFPPPSNRVETAPERLPAWSGSPLDADNLGCWLEAGAALCRLGDPQRLEAVLVVDQSQVEALRAGQAVQLHLDGQWTALPGRVMEIARADAELMPLDLMTAGRVPSRVGASGQLEPLETRYRVRVTLELSARQRPPALDSMGAATVRVTPRSLARRGRDWVRRTFGLGI
ncbi:MAG: HlyD family efflux transporter periplasmic adaptor subunit [Pirellulales bacterium]